MPESKTLRNAEGGIEWKKRSSLMIDSRAHSIETIKKIYTIPCGAYSATQYQYAAGRSIFIIT